MDGFDPDNLSYPQGERQRPIPPEEPPGIREKTVVDADGCEVLNMGRIVSIYDTSGRLLRQENIVDYTKSNILGEYASLEQFIRRWTADGKKTEIRNLLREKGVDLETLKHDLGTVLPALFMYFILSPQFQKQLLDNCTGTTAKGIKADKLKHFKLPLSPLAEQKRIVAKLEELLPLCEKMKGKR